METIIFEGLEYGIVQSETGRLWLDRNLGASQVATSHDDEDAYGDYFKFNNVICPEGWRLPTKYEWEAEIETWVSRNIAGAYASNLKLPAAGNRFSFGAPFNQGYYGLYWSNTEAGLYNAWNLYFYRGYAYTNNYYYRSDGLSLRCIKQ
jgi:uncharacterized protein (TIGR02145 family)